MDEQCTTIVIQRYLDSLEEGTPEEPVIHALLDRAVRRLNFLSTKLLVRSYPRLTQPPLNLQTDELLSSVTERLIKALRRARPATVRQFFALANQHIRWELNDLARRLDKEPGLIQLKEDLVPASISSDSCISPTGHRMLAAIDALPENEREVFDLVRVQGLTQPEAAELLGVSVTTIKRRLNQSLRLLAEQLSDLRPDAFNREAN
jgi:RNA polymerase sigma factor (sigma-70 family)